MPILTKTKQRRVRLRLFTESDTIISINFDPDEQYQLAIGFNATMSTSRQTNRASIQIQGLNRETRALIAGVINGVIDVTNSFVTLPGQDPPVQFGTDLFPSGSAKDETIRNGHAYVELDLGYDPDKLTRAFEGSSHWARHQKAGPVWTTNMDVGDGLSTRLGGMASRTFDPGATTFDVIQYIVKAMGVGPGNLTRDNFLQAVGANIGSELPDGYVVDGDAVPMIDVLLAGGNAEWWVDRGNFYIRAKGEPLEGVPIVIEPGLEGGLRSDPQPIEGGGVLLNSWLRIDARIGRQAHVNTKKLGGLYRLEEVTHRGGNLRGDYQTLMLAKKLETVPGVF